MSSGNYKHFFIAVIISILITGSIFFIYSSDTSTQIIFCDVGQGDAAYMRINNNIDVLVDSGPDDSILRCLGKYMPFYDKTLELAILTHPEKDHYYGFIAVLKRYNVKHFVMNPVTNPDAESFQILLEYLQKEGASIEFPTRGSVIRLPGSSIDIFWPDEEYIAKNSSPWKGKLRKSSVNLNNYSFVFRFREGKISILFTGDSTPEVLNGLLNQTDLKSTVLKIPHHGSRNGLTADFLRLADPMVSVISVGRKNRYNHPSPLIIRLLEARKNKYLRTDQSGDIRLKIYEGQLQLLR